ncbi:MAG TPA: hypothetical protein VGB55_10460, partial [Tepidisphaeraceae bacterium]
MNRMRTEHQVITGLPGLNDIVVGAFLGGGATGEVWSVTTSGTPCALKWYHPEARSERLLRNLQSACELDPPSASFVWPMAVVLPSDGVGFGVLMPLRPARFFTLSDYLNERVRVTALTVLQAGIGLCAAWVQFQAHGLTVSDLSLTNVALDPQTGEVSLCDLDSLVLAGGQPALTPAGPLLTPDTPLWHAFGRSLAASLFVLLVAALPDEQPLDPRGPITRSWDEGFGTIEHAAMLRPSAARWLGMTHSLCQGFASVLGIPLPRATYPTPDDWSTELKAFRDGLLVEDQRATPFAADVDKQTGAIADTTTPPEGNQGVAAFPQVFITDAHGNAPRQVVLTPHSPVLYEDHFLPLRDPLRRIAAIKTHASESGVYRYYNLDTRAARITPADGRRLEIPAGKPMRLHSGAVVTQGERDVRFAFSPPGPTFAPLAEPIPADPALGGPPALTGTPPPSPAGPPPLTNLASASSAVEVVPDT